MNISAEECTWRVIPLRSRPRSHGRRLQANDGWGWIRHGDQFKHVTGTAGRDGSKRAKCNQYHFINILLKKAQNPNSEIVDQCPQCGDNMDYDRRVAAHVQIKHRRGTYLIITCEECNLSFDARMGSHGPWINYTQNMPNPCVGPL